MTALSLTPSALVDAGPALAQAALKAIDILVRVASTVQNPAEARRAASAVLRFIQATGLLQSAPPSGRPRAPGPASASPTPTGPPAASPVRSDASPPLAPPSGAGDPAPVTESGPFRTAAAFGSTAVQRLLDLAGSTRPAAREGRPGP